MEQVGSRPRVVWGEFSRGSRRHCEGCDSWWVLKEQHGGYSDKHRQGGSATSSKDAPGLTPEIRLLAFWRPHTPWLLAAPSNLCLLYPISFSDSDPHASCLRETFDYTRPRCVTYSNFFFRCNFPQCNNICKIPTPYSVHVGKNILDQTRTMQVIRAGPILQPVGFPGPLAAGCTGEGPGMMTQGFWIQSREGWNCKPLRRWECLGGNQDFVLNYSSETAMTGLSGR